MLIQKMRDELLNDKHSTDMNERLSMNMNMNIPAELNIQLEEGAKIGGKEDTAWPQAEENE